MALNPFTTKEILTVPGEGEIDDLPVTSEDGQVSLKDSDVEETIALQPVLPLSEGQSSSDLCDLKEYIVQAYQLSFDKEMAYVKCGATEEQIEILNKDKEFQNRLLYFLIQERENIIADLQELAKSEKEEVALKATLARGKMFYASRFSDDAKPVEQPAQKVDLTIHNTLELAIKKEDHAAQVLGILAENGVFQTGTDRLIDSKVESIHSARSNSKTKRIPMAL